MVYLNNNKKESYLCEYNFEQKKSTMNKNRKIDLTYISTQVILLISS